MDLHDLQRIPESQVVYGTELLKMLPPQTRLFDNDSPSGSDSSVLSAPFSDVVRSAEAVSKRKARDLHGKDMYAAFSFSPEFKAAIEDVKKEMIQENPDYLNTDSLVAENLEQIKSDILKPRERRPAGEVEEFPFFQFPGIDCVVEKSEEDEVEDKKKDASRDKKKKSAKIWLDDDESLYDTMSGYWRLLSGFDVFRISPPWYDAYAEGQEHWLQTKPIPTEVLENSRRKCLNWLGKYFEKK